MAEFASIKHRSDSVVDTEELVVLTEDLYKPSFVLGEQSKILYKIEQAGTFAGSSQHHFEGDTSRFVFAFDSFPFKEAFPVGGERADTAIGSLLAISIALNQKSCGICCL